MTEGYLGVWLMGTSFGLSISLLDMPTESGCENTLSQRPFSSKPSDFPGHL